ncbi:hypothetical protein M9H77_02897 [Catharanthus roseus]|uniref:Uncharacterized protein n=1 Tax=Catharanthus roseus TaxID=4058 RepID=A0ACC0C9V4_CATRO|nr:hypothetical protein M9H77_02897 [Catharanthus roseus]
MSEAASSVGRFSMQLRTLPSPTQADLILIAGTVTMTMAPSLVRLYEQMPEPKYVIAMGTCTITGGMFSIDSYSTVRVVDNMDVGKCHFSCTKDSRLAIQREDDSRASDLKLLVWALKPVDILDPLSWPRARCRDCY